MIQTSAERVMLWSTIHVNVTKLFSHALIRRQWDGVVVDNNNKLFLGMALTTIILK
ncbi:hypothetical protein D3C80_2191320 [compost metagenome]